MHGKLTDKGLSVQGQPLTDIAHMGRSETGRR